MNAALEMDNFESRPLPKQFLVTKREFEPPAGWTRLRFADRYLYKSSELPVTRIENTSQGPGRKPHDMVLGWFVYEGVAYPNSQSDCLRINHSAEHIYPRMTGRFIILSGADGQYRCITDPGGLLPVVYRPNESEIGATPRALELAAPIATEAAVREGFKRQDGTVWYAFGVTPFEGIERLLPGTILDMPSGQKTAIGDPSDVALSPQEAVNRIFNHARDFIGALGSLNRLECHLTAGWDSRMVVSASIRTPAAIDYLTYQTPGANGKVDCEISRLIARKLSLRHKEIALLPASQKDIDDWIWRTAECIEDSVMHLAPTIEATYSGRHVLCGLAGEVGRAFYWHPRDLGRVGLGAGELLKRLGFDDHPVAMELCEEWLGPQASNPTPLILDQAYIDLRLGGWGGASIYGHPVGTPTLTPFNNARIFSLMKALPQRYRLSGQFARDFVSLGSQTLAKLPVNRARGLRRIRYLKKEIAGKLPVGTKRALKTLVAR